MLIAKLFAYSSPTSFNSPMIDSSDLENVFNKCFGEGELKCVFWTSDI